MQKKRNGNPIFISVKSIRGEEIFLLEEKSLNLISGSFGKKMIPDGTSQNIIRKYEITKTSL